MSATVLKATPVPQPSVGSARLPLSAECGVPCSTAVEFLWKRMRTARRNRLPDGSRPSSIEVLAWGVARALQTGELWGHAQRVRKVGVAVALPNGKTGIAIAPGAADFPSFCAALSNEIRAVREGRATRDIPCILIGAARHCPIASRAPATTVAPLTLILDVAHSRAGRLDLNYRMSALRQAQATGFLLAVVDGIG